MYPHSFHPSMTDESFIETFQGLSNGEQLRENTVSLGGRIMAIRTSKNQRFYDLHADPGCRKIQVIANAEKLGLDDSEFSRLHNSVNRCDIVGVTGFPGKSMKGELSLFATTFEVLTPNSKMWPKNLKDQETRYRQRYLDLMLNPSTRQKFKIVDKITEYIRNFLKAREFLEVVTPTLNMIAGGAAARPFVTHHNDLNMDLYMRIAPELNLKQLVVGGLNRVYEIGKQFRNEGMDLTHNPEFTTCEFYMAFADYNNLISMTEEMLSGMVKELTGGYKIKYHSNGFDADPIEIDFTPPFRKIYMIDELNKIEGVNINPEDLSSHEANLHLREVCKSKGIECSPPETTARLLDKLVGHYLEKDCVNPTFIMDHPKIMSPLAKEHRSKPGLTERFELFVNRHELCNAYTEQNDPVAQRQSFADQLKDRQSGDDEAMAFDEGFCVALEYGMPPTAGWGLGMDRLFMLLTDSLNIKEVILFPAMKPQQDVASSKASTSTNINTFETNAEENGSTAAFGAEKVEEDPSLDQE